MTAHPEQALRKILLDDTDTANVVGTRVYAHAVPQAGSLPAITYILESTEPMSVLGGHVGMTKNEFEIRCVADSYATVKDLAEKVRLALDGYNGTVAVSGTDAGDAVVVKWIHHDRTSDETLVAGDGSELPIRIVRIDVSMHTTTEIPS